MYWVDKIDDERYFRYTKKITDCRLHNSIPISEVNEEITDNIKVYFYIPNGNSPSVFQYSNNDLMPPIKTQFSEAKKIYGNGVIFEIEFKNLKRNKFWSKLWEEEKEVKMEQVQ